MLPHSTNLACLMVNLAYSKCRTSNPASGIGKVCVCGGGAEYGKRRKEGRAGIIILCPVAL